MEMPDTIGEIGGFGTVAEPTDISRRAKTAAAVGGGGSGVTPSGVNAPADSGDVRDLPPLTVEDLATFLARLPEVDRAVSDLARAEQLGLLESIKNAAASAQAVIARDLDVSQRAAQERAGVPAERRGLGVGAQVGAARRESPYRGARHLGLAKILHELPHTAAEFAAGDISEWRVMLVAQATATLELADRLEVDARLAGTLAGMSDLQAQAKAKALAYELDPMSPFKRARTAVKDRRVSVRPAPDVMALVTGFVPCAQGVAVKKALRQGAEAIYHAQAAGDPANRTLGQIEADLFVERLTGQSRAEDVDIEVGLVITDTALIAGGSTPARLEGYGPIPALLARELLRPDSDSDTGTRSDSDTGTVAGSDIGTGPDSGTGPGRNSQGKGGKRTQADATRRDTEKEEAGASARTAARVWLRRLFAEPLDGSLIGRDARRRLFRGSLRDFIVARDQTCRTPYCDAPIREADHVVPWITGGLTTPDQGQGLCRRCNLDKQAPGWAAATVTEPDHVHSVVTTMPTAVRPTSHAPPILSTYRPPPPAVRSAEPVPLSDTG